MKSTSSSTPTTLFVGFVALLQASLVSSSTICSPLSCSPLPPTLSFTLGASTPSSPSLLLLPGTYSNPLPSELTVSSNSSSSSPLQSLSTFANYTLSSQASPFTITPNQGIVWFQEPKWAGEQHTFVAVGGGANVTGGRSAILGENVWAKVVVAGEERVLRGGGAVRDFTEKPWGLKSQDFDKVEVKEVQSALCSTPCSSGGSCVATIGSSTNATCVCKDGFEGASCERCKVGFFGSSCSPCASSCLSGQCNDGITGTGICEVSSTNSTVACNCLSGLCLSTTSSPSFIYSSSTTCLCSPGFTTPSLSSTYPSYSQAHQQCSLCSSGYFSTAAGECLACSINAKECSDASTPTTCIEGYEVEEGKCVASNGPSGKGSKCSGSNWWDESSAACTPCSPLCSTCSGSASTACLSCPSGQALLRGVCVDLDSSTGECDSSKVQSGRSDSAGWFYDNSKAECDTCPPKSTGCSIPSFNSTSTRKDVVAKACVDGYVLSLAGVCVTSCPDGEFANDASEGACLACDSSCGTCSGYSTFCTSCASTSNVALEGSCLQTSCPSTTTNVDGECLTCHPDCETCSGTEFDQCSSCPLDRPVLDGGRCLPVCSSGEFLDPSTSKCVACDASCSECLSSSPSSCLTCSSSDHLPLLGLCVSSNCTSSFVPSLQICLADLLTPPSTKSNFPIWTIVLIVLVLLVLFVLGAWWYIRREREKTRQATLRFAYGLDEVKVQRKVWEVGVENVLGLMGKAREGMERKWRERGTGAGAGGGGLRVGGTGNAGAEGGGGSLRPFKLGTGWQEVGRVDEFDMAMEGGTTIYRDGSQRRGNRQGHPPPYSPSSSSSSNDGSSINNNGQPPKLEKFPAQWRSIRSSTFHDDLDDLEEDGFPPPSPPYPRTSHAHSHSTLTDQPSSLSLSTPYQPSSFSFSSTDPSSNLSTILYPSLTPPPTSLARPSIYKTQSSSRFSEPPPLTPYTAASTASSSFNSWETAPPAARDRTIDTEREPFPDFQKDYSSARRTNNNNNNNNASTSGRGAVNSMASAATSRFVEDDDDEEDEDEAEATPVVEKESYWLASPKEEGGRKEVELSCRSM
ncbi:hypothetical protein BDY24DRAFT_418835 [Mrakia frigida]|uniref:uncharacterized protein n=1 Tax=Mrakia frigida TaxID=29902 RepID=UPI003FCC1C7E